MWYEESTHVPYSITFLIRTPICELYVVWYDFNNRYQKDTYSKEKYEIACLKYGNHSRLESQHNWGDPYNHLMNMRISTFIMKKILTWTPHHTRKVATASICICQPLHLTPMLHTLREVGYTIIPLNASYYSECYAVLQPCNENVTVYHVC
jgi:hypothetical protein